MGTFEDDLRASLEEAERQLDDSDKQNEQERQAAKKRFSEAEGIANMLRPKVFEPLLDDLKKVMESKGILFRGRVQQDRPQNCPYYLCCYLGNGTGQGNPFYEIRISSSGTENGEIALVVECFRSTDGKAQGKPLIKPVSKTISASGYSQERVREWCAGVLSECAKACLAANHQRA